VDDVLIGNVTSVALLLEDWPDGGCPLQRLTVEISKLGQPGWKSVTHSALPEGELVLTGLSVGTWYQLRVTVYNGAGNVQHTLVFATRTLDGSLPPAEMTNDLGDSELHWYNSALVVAPIVSGVVCTLAAFICACSFLRRCRSSKFTLTSSENRLAYVYYFLF